MSKIMAKRIAVLQALASGQRLKRVGYSYVWDDGNKAPSTAGDLVSWLYRTDMIEDEVKDPCKGAYGDNLTGYIVITSSGELMLNHERNDVP